MGFWPAMSFVSVMWFCLCVFLAGFFWHAGSWLFGWISARRPPAPPA